MAAHTASVTYTGPKSLSLDAPSPASSVEVTDALGVDPNEPKQKWQLALEKIWAAQEARGYVPRTR